ncbi:universal stress protein [Flavobacteriaceae bacterium TP-CH-4]|uniref:Universal stress protein n=1 Tax=Pelagihabitans pacificus TaxID=2696054 RepID=A0A967E8S2_9FLAO|nr:universal stress protein [Pelagihabitans pacificus]NHF61579.1 universal stress protein [Pelagihabitans pacificus]
MKKIVYATDCTKRSAPALRYAYRLSRSMQAELHVLHVYELPPITVSTIRPQEQLRKWENQEQKEIVANYCTTHLKNELYVDPVKVEVVESSFVAKSIIAACERLDADLVIVGMKDDYTLRGIFAGNIANELLDKLYVPLLVLPNNSYYHGLSTLVYATDFEDADVEAIRSLVSIAEPYRALIKVVHVPLKKESDASVRMEWFEKEVRRKISYPELVFGLVHADDVESGLQGSIQKEHADMLVMMEREHPSLFDKLFHKDLVRSMQTAVSVPLLVFNQQRIRLRMAEQEDVSYSFAF